MAEDAEWEVLEGPESGGFGARQECSFVLFRRAGRGSINEAGKLHVQGNTQGLHHSRQASEQGSSSFLLLALSSESHFLLFQLLVEHNVPGGERGGESLTGFHSCKSCVCFKS